MGKTRITMAGALLISALLTASCASVRQTDEWRDRTFQRQPYTKIMVVALTKQPDLRQRVEDEFSRQIKALGADATACHTCIPDVDKMSREELARIGQEMGTEAYLVVVVLRTDLRIESYRSSIPSMAGDYGRDYGKDSMANITLWGSPDPPLQKRSEVSTLESLLYDGKSAKLVWRSTVESVNPAGDGSDIRRFVRTVLTSLGNEKLFPPAR
jgi:hypothetical protein